RKAVVIDCEMMMTDDPYERGRSYNALAYLAAVDFLTGEVLIDRYVRPAGRVTYWNTRVTGITPRKMNAAIKHGQAFESWGAARHSLWEFVDLDTVLIGHALHNDLNALGIIHPRVVDTAIVTAEAVFSTQWGEMRRFPRLWGLKTLAMDMLGRHIQGGSQGHSAVEDALATRDVLVWGLENPVLLGEWA
ncbi:exonuclease, partial [Aspergillus uvarum CBS 121591]